MEHTRMKKILVGAVMFAALVAAAPTAGAQVQRDGDLIFGFSGGLTLPVGSLGDVQGSGFNLQGHATLKPGSTPFALRGDLGLWTTGGKSFNRLGVTGDTKGVTWFTGNVNALYNFQGSKDDTFVPYVIGGVGLYNGSQGFGTKAGINAGGGVTFKLSGFDAFAEGRFHNIFTDGSSSRIIPLSFGINIRP
jgi:hypothetical protein